MPLTPQIVKNLAEEICGKSLSEKWTSRFIARKKDVLKSVYLTTIDHKRKLADNSSYFEHFYANVRVF
jgi:hypothetical protein